MLDALPLSRKQVRSVAESTTLISCWEGAIRSGKTVASLLRWLIFVAQAPSTGELVIIGKTAQTIHRNLFLPLQDPALFGALSKLVHYTPGAPTATILGRIVHVIGANDAKSEPKIRGMTICGAYVDEVTLVPQIFFEQLLGRMSVEGAQLLCTTNPDNPAHWFMRDWLSQAARKNLRRFSFTIDDNPFLPASYVQQIKASHEGLFFRRFILGEWVAAEGAIYDSWDRQRHTVSTLPKAGIHRWISLGVDYGTTNPFHAVLIGLGKDRKLYAAADWRYDSRQHKRQLTDAEYSQRMRSWLGEVPGIGAVKPQFVTVDPSAASFSTQLRRDHMRPTAAKNDVMDGIRTVSSLLAANKLLIHESCTDLITEIGGYSWDDKAALRGEERPLKVADHGCFVAGTLVTTNSGERPIEAVRPGELVLTRQGFRSVVASGMTSPAAKVYRVRTANGNSLTGTGNHPVWVEGYGWKRLDELRYTDRILICQSESIPSSFKASPSADTRTPKAGPSGPTTRPEAVIAHEACDACMKRSGWPITTAPYPMATTYITQTAIRSTTRRRTWLASPLLSMPSITSLTGGGIAPRRRGSTWTGSAPWPSSGIALQRGARGTKNTAGPSGETGQVAATHASSAARPTSLAPCTETSASAGMRARRRGVEQVVSTTSSGTANAARQPSSPTSTARPGFAVSHVLDVTPLREAVPVWNLTVTDCPEFFAGGVLVHNCDALRYGIFTTRALWQRHLAHAA